MSQDGNGCNARVRLQTLLTSMMNPILPPAVLEERRSIRLLYQQAGSVRTTWPNKLFLQLAGNSSGFRCLVSADVGRGSHIPPHCDRYSMLLLGCASNRHSICCLPPFIQTEMFLFAGLSSSTLNTPFTGVLRPLPTPDFDIRLGIISVCFLFIFDFVPHTTTFLFPDSAMFHGA